MITDMTTQHELIEEEVERLLRFSEDKSQVEFYLKQLNTQQKYIPMLKGNLDEKYKQKLLLFKYKTDLLNAQTRVSRMSGCSCGHSKDAHQLSVCMCNHKKENHKHYYYPYSYSYESKRCFSYCKVCDCKMYNSNKLTNKGCRDCECTYYNPVFSKEGEKKREKYIKLINLLKEKIKDFKN